MLAKLLGIFCNRSSRGGGNGYLYAVIHQLCGFGALTVQSAGIFPEYYLGIADFVVSLSDRLTKPTYPTTIVGLDE